MVGRERVADDVLAAARGDEFGRVGEAADDAHAGEAGGRGGGEGAVGGGGFKEGMERGAEGEEGGAEGGEEGHCFGGFGVR